MKKLYYVNHHIIYNFPTDIFFFLERHSAFILFFKNILCVFIGLVAY